MNNNNATVTKMKEMKLIGMLRAFEGNVSSTRYQDMTQDEFLNHLIQAEWDHRFTKKINSSIMRAKFRYQASMEELNYTISRNLDKNAILRLSDCIFIDKKENVIITGSTGVGKSFIASSIGHQACALGFKVLYFNTAKLFSKLKMSKADATYVKELKRIEKADLLILDDFGLQPFDNVTRLSLLEIIEDRHGKRSTMITSQIPVAKWYELLEEQTIADAILDRIVHSSHRIELKGESMRKKVKTNSDT